jgi:hypothetical protein
MKKLVLIVTAFLGISTGSAFATCTSPAVMHDFASTAFNMSLATNAGDGNCASNVGIIGTLPPFANPPSIANTSFGISGTLPGYTSTPTFNLGTLNGAATAAKQPALGTAGTPSADVISVQGVSGGTPQPISAASGAVVAGALANGASVAQGSTTDAPCTLPASATACSQVAIEKAAANSLNSPGAISQTTDGTTNGVRLTSQYPSGATAVQGSTVGTTAATAATLTATASVTNFVCQISIRANATAAATGNATLSDGTKTYNFTQWTAPAASGLGVVEEIFNPCYPASAVNTAWTLTSAAPGTGGVVSVAISGYQK